MGGFFCEKNEEIQENVSQEITVNLHYLRSDDDYDGWNVWFWTDGDGSSYKLMKERRMIREW